MYKVPSSAKKHISNELKGFTKLVKQLQAKGKGSTEDDARILINDMLHSVLGYDKYNELKTELKDKNGRIDYAVKLSEGPLARKKDRFDFLVEAKAAHISLNQNHIDQTLTYCLTQGCDFFILTNSVKWQLYNVKNSKKNPDAILIHEVNFGITNNVDSLTEDFYLLSKGSYLNGDWKTVKLHQDATKVEDVAAVLLSDKIVKAVTKELGKISNKDIKINPENVRDIIENQIIKTGVENINKKLIKKVDTAPVRKVRKPKNENNIIPFPTPEPSDELSTSDVETTVDIKPKVA